jgi:hypothetical protein
LPTLIIHPPLLYTIASIAASHSPHSTAAPPITKPALLSSFPSHPHFRTSCTVSLACSAAICL